MSEKMSERSERAYRSLRDAQREAHAVIVQVQTRDVPAHAADWWSDLRRRRLNILGGVLRKLDTLHETGRDDLVITLAEVVMAYAKDLAQHDPNERVA